MYFEPFYLQHLELIVHIYKIGPIIMEYGLIDHSFILVLDMLIHYEIAPNF